MCLVVCGGLGEKTEVRPLNRATQSIRQTGSAIEPLSILIPAIDKKIITAASIYDDTEQDFAEGYHPTDYNKSLGKITVRRAVESSQNIPFVEIMQELKPRLRMVYESVPINSVVADIGTDHAFLPIALINGGKATKVIACDINEGPLSVAAKNVQNAGVNNIELRLSDGLEKVTPGEVDVVTVAGMGGDLISGIISKAKWLKEYKTTLILQPMSSADSLREGLYKEGYRIISEKAVEDKIVRQT